MYFLIKFSQVHCREETELLKMQRKAACLLKYSRLWKVAAAVGKRAD